MAMEIFGTAGLMILVLFIFTALKLYFWPVVLKIMGPPKPKPIPVDPNDLYDIKTRERALAQRQIENRKLRREWQEEFDKLVKLLCKHEYRAERLFNWDECTKCKQGMHLYWTPQCDCEWETYFDYTLSSGLHKELRTRMQQRDRECPIHGVKALTKK